jgi:hypothetical protein
MHKKRKAVENERFSTACIFKRQKSAADEPLP